MHAKIDALTRELEQLKNPRVEFREKWNKDDDGPKPNVDALKGGKEELDVQGTSAALGELGLGATRALTEKLPVRPLAGAWEGEAAK